VAALRWFVHQRTPSGGMHVLFFAWPGQRVRSRTGLLPGVDVKGDHGYVIVAPTPGYEMAGCDVGIPALSDVMLTEPPRGRGPTGSAWWAGDFGSTPSSSPALDRASTTRPRGVSGQCWATPPGTRA